MDYYAYLASRNGVIIQKGSSRGSHVTFIRGEPKVNDLWGKRTGDVDFLYAHVLRSDNGRHVWLDVLCPGIHEIRNELGLPPKTNMSFHLTIGRLVS